jgi:hypothetical protein
MSMALIIQQFSENESVDSDYEVTEHVPSEGFDHADWWNVRGYGSSARYL